MCRWIAYSGGPVYLEELLFKPKHSLIDQSLAARSGETTTNGDGVGVGWYGTGTKPGLYKGVQPAWSDENLIDLASQIKSPLFMAHVRAGGLETNWPRERISAVIRHSGVPSFSREGPRLL